MPKVSLIVGTAWVCVTSHNQESENGLIWERIMIFVGKEKTRCIYHYKVVVYTHCQHTFMFKLHVK